MLANNAARFHPTLPGPNMAIGAWHVRAHIPRCQREYSQRLKAATGHSFGDNCEHMWAAFWPFSHLLKYMSRSSSQDYLSELVGLLAWLPLLAYHSPQPIRSQQLYALAACLLFPYISQEQAGGFFVALGPFFVLPAFVCLFIFWLKITMITHTFVFACADQHSRVCNGGSTPTAASLLVSASQAGAGCR
jgi:hypothetical protein